MPFTHSIKLRSVNLRLDCSLIFVNWIGSHIKNHVLQHTRPLFMGFSWQEYWSGLPFPPPEGLSDPGIELASPGSPALQVDSFPLNHLGIPLTWIYFCFNKLAHNLDHDSSSKTGTIPSVHETSHKINLQKWSVIIHHRGHWVIQ